MRQIRPGQLGQFWLGKRPNSQQWCRVWYDGDRRQTRYASLETEDQGEAQRRLAQWFLANSEIRDERPQQQLIEFVLRRHYELHGKHLASAKAIAASHAYWSTYFEDATVADVTSARVVGFVRALREANLSDAYIRRILADGKAAINAAVKRGELTHAPHIVIGLVAEPPPRERILKPSEMANLLDATTIPHVRLYMLLALGTMARPEAITDLTTWSIDWGSGSIDLLPRGRVQNKKRRPIVPIVKTLRPILAALPVGALITFNGRQVQSVRTSFEKCVDEAGLSGTGVNRYTLRHTIISEAMKRCAEPWQVERFAGHRTGSKTTERYVKFSAGYLGKAAAAIDDYFEEVQALMQTRLTDHLGLSAFELRASLAGKNGGAEGDRTPDLYTASVALSQLSYGPEMSSRDGSRAARRCL